METLQELIDEYSDQEKMHFEGRRGLENLCKLIEALGYRDTLQYFGQLNNGACIGSLTDFLEDNSGCIEAMITWISKMNNPEWRESIKSSLNELTEEEQEELHSGHSEPEEDCPLCKPFVEEE